MLLRLSDANFHFTSARDNGSDLRFIAADGKTVLPFQLESYDNVLNEAFVWVKLPEVKAAATWVSPLSNDEDFLLVIFLLFMQGFSLAGFLFNTYNTIFTFQKQ